MTIAAAIDIIAAHARSLRLWTVRLIAWLTALMDKRAARLFLRQELRFLRGEIRGALVMRAALALKAGHVRLKRNRRRPHLPGHIVRQSRRHLRRYVLRGVRLPTLEAAKRVLDNLEAHVARCIANMRVASKDRARWRVGDLAAFVASADAAVCAPDSS